MSERRLGKSTIEIPPVVFGAWAVGGWFWGGADDGAGIDAIRAGVDAGITAIDTAPMYGFGHSEAVVGKAIKGIRDQVVVMTKCGLRWDDARGDRFFDAKDVQGVSRPIYRNLRPDSIRFECEQSLRRLGVETIDVYQCHWPDPTTEVEETMEVLAALVAEGKIRAVGVSNFSPDLLARAQRGLGGVPLASEQPHYSLINRRVEREVLPWCREHGVGVLPYSPMERGLLTGKVDAARVFDETDGRASDPLFSVKNRAGVASVIKQAQDLVDSHGATMAQLAVAWVFHQPGVTAALVGARSPEQAIENAAAAQIVLPDEDLTRLASLFDEAGLTRR